MQNIKYKKLCTRIAIAVLLNTILLQTISTVAYGVAPAFDQVLRTFAREHGINTSDLLYAFEQTLALFAYLISFLIPAFVFKFMTRNDDPEPMRLGVKLEPNTPIVILGSIGIVVGAAYINSFMVSFIDFSPLFESDPLSSPVRVLMTFISIAIVPALSEEFLFRGCILSNLLPYGKNTAILFSALLFALMHGNFAQFFYTFIAGIVLGAVYVKTDSIWAPTFIHLFNNFYSVIQQVVYEQNAKDEQINKLLFVLDMTLVCFGLAIGGWFLYKTLRRAEPAPAAVPTQKHALGRKELAKGFFNHVMIVHIAVSLVLAGILVFYALMLPLMQ
ncbi:MAG: CPBP family intramembrane metalloprotease [Clostridia bacterium]|nr:CPBP family intramembrane metalloprotease [Clostridia bacterium]